jgi:hypothetical protein
MNLLARFAKSAGMTDEAESVPQACRSVLRGLTVNRSSVRKRLDPALHKIQSLQVTGASG